MDAEAFRREAEVLGLALREEQIAAFAAFEDSLYAANEVMNLTRVPREEAWIRHFVDSLLFHDLIPQGARVLDLGSGPGFPAWPLACARPDLQVVALDSSGKMLGFLRRHLLPNLRAVQERAEDWTERGKFDVVTGRAVAPLPIQLELSAAYCRVGGTVVPMRTDADLGTIESLDPSVLGLKLANVVRKVLPVVDAPRVFPVYVKSEKTPAQFPRKWADIKKAPVS